MFQEMMPMSASGGGELNLYEYLWENAPANNTKQVTLDFSPLIVVSIYKTKFNYTVWYRASTSDAWTKVGKPSSYTSTYITDITGDTVTFKNGHSTPVTYWLFATDDVEIKDALVDLFV